MSLWAVVSKDKWNAKIRLTLWNEAHVFMPCYWKVGVFALASKPGFNLFQWSISAKELSLGFSQRRTRFNEIYILDARRQ